LTESIVLQVCRELKIDPVDFFSRRTAKKLVKARRLAIMRLREAGFSQMGISRMIRRNYSTIRYWTKPGYREKHSKYYAAYNASKRAEAPCASV
jgi:IS30 family transposase